MSVCVPRSSKSFKVFSVSSSFSPSLSSTLALGDGIVVCVMVVSDLEASGLIGSTFFIIIGAMIIGGTAGLA